MKILLITGQSGVGKSTIVKYLLEYDGYKNIKSFTDRPQRREERDGFSNHIFVNHDRLAAFSSNNNDVVASTQIDKYTYCTFQHQFDKDMINVYIVDLPGMNQVIDFFPHADIMTVLIRRNDVEIENFRQGRNLRVPARDDVHFCLDNNGPIENAQTLAGVLNVLSKNDFFAKPSHKARTIEDLLQHCDDMDRYIETIRASLLKQQWYRDKPIYDKFCDFIVNDIKEFDFDIEQEHAPFVEDGLSPFYVIIIPKDNLDWSEENRLIELATQSLWHFGEKFDISSNMLDSFSIIIPDKEEVI